MKLKDQIVRDAMHLQSVWLKGDLELILEVKKADCVDLVSWKSKVSEEFYQCNPLYLECFLQSSYGQKLTYQNAKESTLTWSKNGSAQVKLATGHTFYQVMLLNICHHSYLPEGRYSAGPKDEKQFLWDNFNRSIYLDKYYVTNFDVWHWYYRRKLLTTELDTALRGIWPSANVSLNQKEREEYCLSLGKKVLRSHYFDAGAGLAKEKKLTEVSDKFPFHWTKQRKSFLNSSDQNLNRSNCFNAYVKGCEKYRAVKYYEGLSTTWMGMHYALGSLMEYLPNPFLPKANLKVSSLFLPKESFWHELGLRAHWISDEDKTQIEWIEQYSQREDQLIDKLPSDEYQVGFRCVLD